MSEEKNKTFEDFTNLYEVSKTLPFELKPVPETRKHLDLENPDKNRRFPNDRYRAENFEIIKNYIDQLHGAFIDQALGQVNIDFSEYINKFRLEKTEDKRQNNDEEENGNNDEKELRRKICSYFNEISKTENYKNWVKVDINKSEVSGELFHKELIGILREYFKNELETEQKVPELFFNKDKKGETRKLIEVLNNFDRFTTYFTDSFYNNRKNYYKAEGKASQVATRIIDENLKRFCNNLLNFLNNISKYENLISKFDNDWKEYFEEKGIDNQIQNEFKNEGYKWKDLFSEDGTYYNRCFLQKQINTYNIIIKKLNNDIAKYKQSEEYKSNRKGRPELKLFDKLFKQIHGSVVKIEEEIKIDENNIFQKLNEFIVHSDKKIEEAKAIFCQFLGQKDVDINKIYFSKRAIETISAKWFASWDSLDELILESINKNLSKSKQRKKLPDFIDAGLLKTVLENNKNDFEDLFRKKYFENGKNKEKFAQGKNWDNFLNIFNYELLDVIENYNKSKEDLLKLIRDNVKYDKNDEKQILKIKNFADFAQAMHRMVNYFALRKKGVAFEDPKNGKDQEFYELIDKYLDGDEQEEECLIIPYYNALRNFVSKKPWSIDNIRIMFESGEFLKGWDKDKIDTRLGIIMKKGERYYLGIVNGRKNFLNSFSEVKNGDEYFVLFEYKQLSKVFRQFPRLGFPSKKKNIASQEKAFKERAKLYGLTKELLQIKDEYDLIKNKIDKEKLSKLIEYYKVIANKKYSGLYNLGDIYSRRFTGIKEFNNYIEKLMYSFKEGKKISEHELQNRIKNGEIYLFQIYNKDFELDEEIGKNKYGESFKARKTEGKENLHTDYFKMLFDEKNLKNPDGVVFKLSGGGKAFYRPNTEEIPKKKNRHGKEIIEKLRYSEDKYFLHLSINLNFINKGKDKAVNDMVNAMLGEVKDETDKFRIIGLDRGEKNLAYFSVINEKQEILDQGSLNYIERRDKDGNIIQEINRYHDKNGNFYKEEIKDYKDYQNLLDKKEIDRLKSRQSWEKIENIKELKNGYVSMVVNKICNLVVQAIRDQRIPLIVLENLNSGMKRGRQKIEKQIYQKLEIKLAEKLSFLVDKKEGNFLKAWQLVPKIENYGKDLDIKKQVGIIFYVDPSFTSAICPNCGFRKRIKIDPQNAREIAKEMEISYEDGRYIFQYKVGNGELGYNKIYSDVERLKWDDTARAIVKTKSVTDDFDKLFAYIDDKTKLKEQILMNADPKFWKEFSRCLNLILRIRNSQNKKRKFNEETGEICEEGENRDFIFCPQCHFHSEEGDILNKFRQEKYRGRNKFEFNGDANGAYNIARKGLIAAIKIKEHFIKLDNFKKEFRITELPKSPEDKKELIIGGEKHILTLKKVKNGDSKKDVWTWQLINDKDIKKEIVKYPDLFVSLEDWDKFVQGADANTEKLELPVQEEMAVDEEITHL